MRMNRWICTRKLRTAKMIRMYLMNTMNLLFKSGGIFEKSPSRRDFLRFYSPVFRFIHLHQVHSLNFAFFFMKIIVLNVPNALGCTYVIYKEFLVIGSFLVYCGNFWMYLRSTSKYIETPLSASTLTSPQTEERHLGEEERNGVWI
jgi:hypothetical protein